MPRLAKPPAKRVRVRRRPPGHLTVANVVAALRASHGIRSLAADKLKVNRSTITRFCQAHPSIEEVEQEIVDGLVDLSVGKLILNITNGEFPSIRYYLDAKGHKSGFGINRWEVTGKDGGPVRTAHSQDFSNLTLDEQLALEALTLKTLPAASGS